MTGPEILDALVEQDVIIDQSTLTQKIIPELKPYGLRNKPRVGYHIPAAERPKK